MKLSCLLVLLAGLLSGYAPKNPAPLRALEVVFAETFPNADKVQWKKEGLFYHVYCLVDDTPVRASYTEQGQMKSCLRYYGEKGLPPYIRSTLVRRFGTTEVLGVTEYYNDGMLTFTINLKKGGQLVRLITDGLGTPLQVDYFKDKTAKP